MTMEHREYNERLYLQNFGKHDMFDVSRCFDELRGVAIVAFLEFALRKSIDNAKLQVSLPCKSYPN